MMKPQLTLPVALATVVLAPAAQAHVTVHPNVIPAGQFAQLVVRVANERQDAATTRIDVRFPPGFAAVYYAPVREWSAKVVYRKLARPVTAAGESRDQEVGDVIWSGGRIEPGQSVDLPLSVAMPRSRPGTILTFKALQTYSSGEIVRWIGGPSSDTPAPQIALADEDAPTQDVPARPVAGVSAGGPAAPSREDSRKEKVALSLGALGAFTGTVAFALALVLVHRSRR